MNFFRNLFKAAKTTANANANATKPLAQTQQAIPQSQSFFNKYLNHWYVAYIGIAFTTFTGTYYYKIYKSQKLYQQQYFKKQEQKKEIIDQLQKLQQVFGQKVKLVSQKYPTTQKRMEQRLNEMTVSTNVKMKYYYNTVYLQNFMKFYAEQEECQKKYDVYKDRIMTHHFNIDNIETQIPQLKEIIHCYDILDKGYALIEKFLVDQKLNLKKQQKK